MPDPAGAAAAGECAPAAAEGEAAEEVEDGLSTVILPRAIFAICTICWCLSLHNSS